MNIVLIGYRGSGKTSIAKTLGMALHRQVVETDILIEEKTGKKVSALVKARGWEYFRKLEEDAVREAAGMDKAIIATGGGAVMNPENAERLKKNGIFVLLTADISVIRKRLAKAGAGKRPPLKDKNAVAEVETVLAERMPVYKRLADFVVDTSGITIDEASARIINRLRKSGVV